MCLKTKFLVFYECVLNKNMNLLVKNDDVCRVGVCNDAIVTVTVVFVVVVDAVVVVELVPVLFLTIKTDDVASFSFAPHNHWQFSFATLSYNAVLAKLFDGLMFSDVLGVAQVFTVVHSIDLLKEKKNTQKYK